MSELPPVSEDFYFVRESGAVVVVSERASNRRVASFFARSTDLIDMEHARTLAVSFIKGRLKQERAVAFTVDTIVSAIDRTGKVTLSLGEHTVTLDIDQAVATAVVIIRQAAAAEQDALLFRWLLDNVMKGADAEGPAGQMLQDFREYRREM